MSTSDIKAAVRQRDGYVCTKCGMTDAEHQSVYQQTLQVHRLTPGGPYTLDGCVTVCQGCHGKLPKRKKAGIKKASRAGMTPMFIELSDEDAARLDALIASLPLGGKADHIRLAVRRHLDNPPTVAVPQLPPATVAPKPKPARKPRKKEAKS